jgi:hypothetical protein
MSSLPYYYRTSPGTGTNLQLYSLRQAWRCWQDLNSKKDQLGEGKIRERCVLTVVLLGLSLSQLLGQNTPLTSESIPPPRKLLPVFLDQTAISDTQKNSLICRFGKFMNVYNDCRHFGPPKYEELDKLDLKATESFVNLTIEIWNIVIGHFEVGQGIFKSICEILDESNENEEYFES